MKNADILKFLGIEVSGYDESKNKLWVTDNNTAEKILKNNKYCNPEFYFNRGFLYIDSWNFKDTQLYLDIINGKL